MNSKDIQAVTEATLTGSKVVIKYTDRVGKESFRQVQPEQIDRHGIVARCDLRGGGFRRFNADRVSDVHLCEA
jgi:predicted DNA-binding transcriptional regulator YafY